MKTRTLTLNQNMSRTVADALTVELTFSKWLQCLIYVALIAFTNLYLGLFNSVHAADAALAAAVDQNSKLDDIMKQVGADFKAINKSVTDVTQADANAAKAAELADLFSLALQRTPDSIAKMPAGNQAAATQSYQAQIKAMVGLCQGLEAAFKAKDLTGTSPTDKNSAQAILSAMSDGKEKGHDDFKPDDN